MLVPVIENGLVKDGALMPILAKAISLLGETAEGLVQQAYWINNPHLATQFEVFFDCLAAKHTLNPSEFNSKGWRYASTDQEIKAGFMAKLQEKLDRASELMKTQDVIVVVQGTRENAAHRIAKNGFGTLASLDPGWYGQGIYFTSRMAYAGYYCKPAKDGSLVFIISLAAPGNSLPVSASPFQERQPNPQGYLGKPCHPGYQSHFTIVETNSGLPLRKTPSDTSFDELVVFEPAQVLPIFLVHVRPGIFGLLLLLLLFFFAF